MKNEKMSLYALVAAITASSLLLAGGTALAREAESGGGSSSGSGSSVSGSGGSASIDDNLPRNSGVDNNVGGVDLRGDGTVDDGLPRRSGVDNNVGGVDLRGDGTVEDNSFDDGVSGFDSLRDLQERGGFARDLSVGARDDDVTALQRELQMSGLFSATATGFFGDQTRAAVIEFQREHALPQTGFVGPLTREELNRQNAALLLSDDSRGPSDNSRGPSSSSGPGSDSSGELETERGNEGENLSFAARIGSGVGGFFRGIARILGF